jgi:Mg-chelatase subunit ChlD
MKKSTVLVIAIVILGILSPTANAWADMGMPTATLVTPVSNAPGNPLLYRTGDTVYLNISVSNYKRAQIDLFLGDNRVNSKEYQSSESPAQLTWNIPITEDMAGDTYVIKINVSSSSIKNDPHAKKKSLDVPFTVLTTVQMAPKESYQFDDVDDTIRAKPESILGMRNNVNVYYPRELSSAKCFNVDYSLNTKSKNVLEYMRGHLFNSKDSTIVSTLWGEYYVFDKRYGANRSLLKFNGIHEGIDLYSNKGDDFYSLTNGTVAVPYDADYGRIVIKSGDYYIVYMHAKYSYIKDKMKGEEIKAGEKLGKQGSIGNDGISGPEEGKHVHVSVRKDANGIYKDSNNELDSDDDLGKSMYEALYDIINPDGVLQDITYDSASEAGKVTEPTKPSEPTQSELSAFSATPIEAVLVLDASGSMDRRNPNNGKSVLSYAQDAAVAFAQTLFALNPESRISVVAYESDIATVCELTRAKDSIALQSSIRFIRSGGNTNTGGGYARADEILKSQSEGDRKCVVLMLSDGMANVGPDAVTEGRRVAQSASVYTIGLVGGMSSSERDITHQILREGYQTQYFEVDFSSVSDISLYLAEAFLKIAMAGGQDVQETYYSLSVDGALEVRVANAAGETLCSASDMLDTDSSYGMLHFLGDEMDDKLLVLQGGDYDILLRGSEEKMGSFALTSFNGVGMDMEHLLDSAVKIDPATCIALHVKDGKVTQENIPFNPIDPYAIDPFTGAPTKGLSLTAQGYVLSNTAVYAANHKKATVLEKLLKNVPVNVYALDPLTGWYLVGVTGKDGIPLRGWADGKTLDIKGYVPEMQFIGGEYTLAEGSPLYLAPSYSSRTADQVASGTVVELKHVERDRQGEEWAYVKTTLKNKDTWGYVPSRMLAGFQSIAPEGFRLGGDMPLKVYEKTFGENKYSEWMWASSPNDGDGGVVLSGRTSSTKGDITKALGGRDAWIMRLDEQGDVSKVLTTGGSEVDSYHCVLPTEKGYLVSGITRSLDKNFQGIWDTGYYLGTVPQKLSWSNALIGLLDESFEPVWLKSFGTGSGSYGFDMVLKLSDGSIAGVGWSTAGRGSVLSDHGKQDFYAVKMTQSGQVMAMNCFGGAMDDVPDGGVATPDGGMLMIGRTASSHQGGGRYDGYALKLDASLAIEWEFSYGGNGEDTFDNVRMLTDGTYLITGFTNSATGTGAGTAKGGMDFWAMRIDQFGRPIWNLRYGGSGDEELRGTTLLEDGRLILVGDTTSQDGQVRGYQRAGGKAASTDGWAVCINEMGKVIWQYCLGGTGNDYFNSAAIDPADGCLVLAGVKDKKNDENAKAWAVKIQLPVNNPAD